jgi:hypothetical protein
MAANKGVTVVGLESVLLRLDGIRAFKGSKRLMEEIGSSVVEQILKRTAEGKDVSDANFTPYSEPYKKVRAKRGLPTDKLDLFFSGSMLSAMTYAAKKKSVRVFFMDTAGTSQGSRGTTPSVSNAEKAVYNQERREFFGLSSEDVKSATDLARRWVRLLIGDK